MIEDVLIVLGVALLGSLLVPIAILVMARIGAFNPIEFELFGHTFRFRPKRK